MLTPTVFTVVIARFSTVAIPCSTLRYRPTITRTLFIGILRTLQYLTTEPVRLSSRTFACLVYIRNQVDDDESLYLSVLRSARIFYR